MLYNQFIVYLTSVLFGKGSLSKNRGGIQPKSTQTDKEPLRKCVNLCACVSACFLGLALMDILKIMDIPGA